MIARAAEGSARDALSLFDQAIAHAGGRVEAETVSAMLGLADRSLVIDLFGEIMKGEVAEAIARLRRLYDIGADPSVVLEDLAAFTHLVTRLKVAPSAIEDEALSEEEKSRGSEFADRLPLRVLARTWQMLLKGIDEARAAARPLAAADMVVVRLAHAADLPTPDEALKALRDGAPPRPAEAPAAPAPSGDGRQRMSAGARPQPASAPPRQAPRTEAPATRPLARFEDVVALAGEKRELKLKHDLEAFVRPIRFEPGQIDIALTDDAPPGLAGELAAKLEAWTGRRWMVAVGRNAGAPTVAEARRSAQARLVSDARADPVVAAVLARFPGAEIVDVRVRGDETAAAAAPETVPPPLPDDLMDEDD
jgi:DNA polymerase-3 subunit gamma/tau